MKADLAIVFLPRRDCELTERFDYRRKLLVVGADTRVQFGQFLSELFLVENHLTKGDESSHYDDAHLDRLPTIEDGCRHEGSMFRKDKGRFASASVAPT